ncbi:transcription factor DIVARICATA-like [Punica granatum]|uniref:Uncharacterized protein n=2 Tax=Punica granatum TaxID=22663 RepID=A0A218WC02_PUNGR|nr:transcription factor DIVARICATA-like [Punica granatum]OWM69988.1 hypothetical protein CDL15_Pgr025837 [Punica granatum]PKI39605.1 hypothetical protein CRG98_040075 [Punica granatum]
MELETFFQNTHFSINSGDWLLTPSTRWTREENKQFERALAVFDKETPDRWVNIALMIPGKSPLDVMTKYRELEEDLIEIEAGRVPIPWYFGPSLTLEGRDYDGLRKKGSAAGRVSDQERKKGIPWTEEEHRRFLQGLLKYGKGDWRNISRNYVVSKTPTQVASHAQKYFIRQQLSSNSNSKDNRRRPSIHDITTRNLTDSSLPLSENNLDIIANDCNNSSSTRPLSEQKPNFCSTRPSSGLCDVAPSGLRLQEKDLRLGAFRGFGIKPSSNPLFEVQSTMYRIYG